MAEAGTLARPAGEIYTSLAVQRGHRRPSLIFGGCSSLMARALWPPAHRTCRQSVEGCCLQARHTGNWSPQSAGGSALALCPVQRPSLLTCCVCRPCSGATLCDVGGGLLLLFGGHVCPRVHAHTPTTHSAKCPDLQDPVTGVCSRELIEMDVGTCQPHTVHVRRPLTALCSLQSLPHLKMHVQASGLQPAPRHSHAASSTADGNLVCPSLVCCSCRNVRLHLSGAHCVAQVIFGGVGPTGALLNDTWLWDR